VAKQTIEQVDVAHKRVLMRVDFNVPIENGKITDDRRIQAAMPSIRSVLDRGGRLILMSHLGRPSGEGFEAKHSLKPVAERLGELLGKGVSVPSEDPASDESEKAAESLEDGDVILLENLRFHPGEKGGNGAFAATLAGMGEIYCNDAFGTSHRDDASMVAVPRAMEGRPRVAGLLLEKELTFLSEKLESPERPYAAVLGGVKVSDKIGAVEHLIPRTDHLLIGGAMAYTFLKALGKEVGSSRVETDRIADAKRMLELAAHESCDLHLPIDHVCSTQFASSSGDVEVFKDHIKPGFMGLDIGPETQTRFAGVIEDAKTVVWNGPMGVFEWPPFAVGTGSVARAIAKASDAGALTIVGGGDTASAASTFDIEDRVSHVSTGGGASLAMIAGETLESVELLDDA
jgi:phosphoglycerate kinase